VRVLDPGEKNEETFIYHEDEAVYFKKLLGCTDGQVMRKSRRASRQAHARR
jgi:hypothetical protein